MPYLKIIKNFSPEETALKITYVEENRVSESDNLNFFFTVWFSNSKQFHNTAIPASIIFNRLKQTPHNALILVHFSIKAKGRTNKNSLWGIDRFNIYLGM